MVESGHAEETAERIPASRRDCRAKRTDNDLRLAINALDGERLADVPENALSPSELRTGAANLFYLTTIEGYAQATALIERAIRLDPHNAKSRAMWVEGRLTLAEARYETLSSETVARLLEAADQSVQTAPRSDYSYYVRTHVRTSLLVDFEGARRDARRVRQLNPDYTLGYEADGFSNIGLGDYGAAIRVLEACVDRAGRDPFLPLYLYELAAARLLPAARRRPHRRSPKRSNSVANAAPTGCFSPRRMPGQEMRTRRPRRGPRPSNCRIVLTYVHCA